MYTSTLESERWLATKDPARLWRVLLATPTDPASAVARIALGIMILPHGMQKALGWFGGPGLEGTIAYFTGTMGLPLVVAGLVVAAEFLGGLALLVGLCGRIAAAGVGAVMVGAALTTHVQHGFFMNWFGALPAGSEGWEFHLLATALAVVVVLRGSGAISLDRLFTHPGGSSAPGGR